MENKKQKNISISLDDFNKNLLDVASKKLGRNKSSIVQELISIYLDSSIGDYDEIPILLRIPVDFKNDRNKIKEIINDKLDIICDKVINVK